MSSKRKTPVEQVFTQLRAARDKDSFGLGYGVSWLLENEQVYLQKEQTYRKMSSFTIQELEFIKSELKYRANYAPEENTEEQNRLYNSIDMKITVIIEQINQNKDE
tara:strand:+ start:142 stop:459 length:318 start_codon:yes stop_codon:yes gene_type:complete